MQDALDLLARVPAVLVFLAALTIVAECASITGLFDAVADRVVGLARGRVLVVWLLFMTAAAVVTAFLSLDTTAVLMTSAAVVVARRLERPVATFAFPTLWIANMASLWLPASNLTNLLARDVRPRPDALAFVAESWPVALTTTLVPLLVAAAIWPSHLSGMAPVPAEPTPARREATRTAIATIIVVMCVAILVVEPALAASAAAIACVGVLAVRRRSCLREIELPWRSLAITTALFAVVAAVHGSGLLQPGLDEMARAPAWALGLTGGLLANVLNNLPAYLALEPAAHGESHRVLALLIGVNVTSGLTWWGSVATLLWRERLRRAGVQPSWGRHLRLTGLATAVTSAAALAVLHLVRP